jgi:hypothetical protein
MNNRLRSLTSLVLLCLATLMLAFLAFLAFGCRREDSAPTPESPRPYGRPTRQEVVSVERLGDQSVLLILRRP